jgi:putative nucleotidyltransferase with HDIG domain
MHFDKLPALSPLGRRWGQWIDNYFPTTTTKSRTKAPTPLPNPWPRKIGHLALYSFSLLSLTAVHGIRYYDEPQLAIGQRAPETLFAPRTDTVEDPEATAAARATARSTLLPVLQVNESLNQTMQSDLQILFEEITRLRQATGPFPYLSPSWISTSTQVYLRQLSPQEWQTLYQAVNTGEASKPDPRFQKAYQELQSITHTLQQRDPALATTKLSDLYNQITQAQNYYRQAQIEFSTLTSRLSEATLNLILSLTPEDWKQVQESGMQALIHIQTIGIAPGLPPDFRLKGIQAQVALAQLPDIPEKADIQKALIQWLNEVIRPNLELDKARTQEKMLSLEGTVDPVMIPVTRGEILVRSGQEITPKIFLLLDHFGLTQRRVNWWGLMGVAGLMSIGILLFIPIQKRLNHQITNRDRSLILLSLLSVAPMASAFGVQFSPLPAVGMLLSSFYGTRIGLLMVLIEAALLPLATPVSISSLIPLVLGSMVACLGARRLRSREELSLLGVAAALIQMLCQGILSLAAGGGLDLIAIGLAGGTGLGWTIIALGASPYLERLFDLITPIRLLELANPNRPLLRRLATEAPGTFQHTLFVASLAERAAQRLSLNAELVRTGTLYHDIGKMLKAQYFIENQMGRPNPHIELNDPYQSAEIIKAHVSDGLKLAKQYGLPQAIQAFIPEHQGTMRIAYFYHQAQQKAGGQDIAEQIFRYEGPIPQTPETGIVMLADACEAALRSMGVPACLGYEALKEGRETVRRIFQARWQDGQLKDSGLTLADLEVVADAFIEVWQESHHERIPYPKSAVRESSGSSSEVELSLNGVNGVNGVSPSVSSGSIVG